MLFNVYIRNRRCESGGIDGKEKKIVFVYRAKVKTWPLIIKLKKQNMRHLFTDLQLCQRLG